MWLFGRKAKAQASLPPDAVKGTAAEPRVLEGTHLIRRTEITVEREWSSTVTRTGKLADSAEIVLERSKDDEHD